MTKENWLLIGAAVVLLAAYAIFFTDWFKPQTVKIFHTSRNLRPQLTRAGTMPNLIFGFNRQMKLTDIKLVPLAEFQTNARVLPLWHLVSDSNSVPIKSVVYGQSVRGLKPAVPGAHPQPLATNVIYRLIVQAGKIRGEHDFELK